jgi:hypothetical protein
MSKVTDIRKKRDAKKKSGGSVHHEGFTPCSQDLTICSDCEDNRARNKCPRLKEWIAKKKG